MTLKLLNLSKRKGDIWVIRDVSLEVEKGEILGIFGTSANEISHFIQIIAGLEEKDSGKILFENLDFSDSNKRKRSFFYFTNQIKTSFLSKLFKFQTQNENQDWDFDKILQNAQKVFLFEKPLDFFDKNKRLEKADFFRKAVQEKNIAAIISANDFEEIFLICDRIAIINHGRIIQTGTPREIYQQPDSVAVAEITGRNNLITARRISSTKKETPEFQTIEGEHRLFTEKIEKKDLGAINQNITLAIRPEHISISFGASFPADNLLKAEITDIKYLGATTLIKLNANGLALKALVLRLVGLKIGDECVVGLPPERIRVLKD